MILETINLTTDYTDYFILISEISVNLWLDFSFANCLINQSAVRSFTPRQPVG